DLQDFVASVFALHSSRSQLLKGNACFFSDLGQLLVYLTKAQAVDQADLQVTESFSRTTPTGFRTVLHGACDLVTGCSSFFSCLDEAKSDNTNGDSQRTNRTTHKTKGTGTDSLQHTAEALALGSCCIEVVRYATDATQHTGLHLGIGGLRSNAYSLQRTNLSHKRLCVCLRCTASHEHSHGKLLENTLCGQTCTQGNLTKNLLEANHACQCERLCSLEGKQDTHSGTKPKEDVDELRHTL